MMDGWRDGETNSLSHSGACGTGKEIIYIVANKEGGTHDPSGSFWVIGDQPPSYYNGIITYIPLSLMVKIRQLEINK